MVLAVALCIPLIAFAAEKQTPSALDWVDTRFSNEQLDQLKQMLLSEIDQGAIGVGLSLAYHAAGTTSREADIYQEAAAEAGALVSLHGRYLGDRPPHTGLVGLEENGVPQMRYKGRMQQGMDADITIFDPETVRDNATLETPARPSTGIPYVLVNGQVVVENGAVLKTVKAGVGIKHLGRTASTGVQTFE